MRTPGDVYYCQLGCSIFTDRVAVKVLFSQACVILSMGERGSASSQHASLVTSLPSVGGGGVFCLDADPSPFRDMVNSGIQSITAITVNLRTVHILLEYILVTLHVYSAVNCTVRLSVS